MIVLIIKEGKLFRERHGKNEDENYVAKLISYDYLDEMVDLIQRVYDALPLKEVLMVDSYDDMKNDMDNQFHLGRFPIVPNLQVHQQLLKPFFWSTFFHYKFR